MNSFRSLALVAGAFAAQLAAQDSCPMQTTQHVPESVTYGPPQQCGGFSYSIGDLQLSAARGACPLFVIHTPPHEIAVPSGSQTMVDVVAQVPITKITFVCETRWFLIVPVGSSCVADRVINVASVHQMVTRPCPALNP